MAQEKSLKWDEDRLLAALSKENAVELRVMKALEDLTEPFTILVLIDAKDYAAAKRKILERYGRDDEIIYITLNAGFPKIKHDFEREKRDYANIRFLDMVSVEAGERVVDDPNAVYISSPSDLTDCMVNTERLLAAKEGKKVLVILDSISTMLIYNNPSVVEKFTHTLLGKINAANASAIVFSSDYEERDAITSTIGQFFDRTVKV
ncbi:MAG TPA: hypothetical protein HA254_04255 [Candidatus Diapherotrites archaeon]|uniref:KaiC-like domain-containing protein n=1 Tax=Candidatus Iainarchaeum sp. TaxID=3101447 RepID=A0A7J4J3Q1_9ARCH|nr:hypothetical protein [Candidatus Diapherotrites archaeon]